MGAGGGFRDWEQQAERRDQAAEQRDEGAVTRDDSADERDRASRRRDELASDREQAAQQREKAALQRDREATTREFAAERRDRAADRRERPADAGQVARYEQAALERAQHGRDTAPDWILGRARRRMRAVRGRAQATARASADMVERFIQAKEREVAAHLASIQVHERMASLLEGLGRAERAAEARAQAERARELHRAAGAELAEYVARIRTIEDGKLGRRPDGSGRPGG